MSETPANGTRREIDGEMRVYYDGYWIKHYDPPPDTLEARKGLIQALTRRLFNHVEHGINIPGARLAEARAAYQAETDTERKRVNGAMLAGALFNRAADIFTCLVDLQAAGVTIGPENTLMRECGQCLMEALDLGKMVKHRGGDEGIDELWGEPFRAFSIPIEAFYESRYVKMAMTMRDIDRIGAGLKDAFSGSTQIVDVGPRVDTLAEAAKRKCEILRTDIRIFDVWPDFVVARERLCNIQPLLPPVPDAAAIREALEGTRLLRDGTDLVMHIVRARVPMPKSTREFLDRCNRFRQTAWQNGRGRVPEPPAPGRPAGRSTDGDGRRQATETRGQLRTDGAAGGAASRTPAHSPANGTETAGYWFDQRPDRPAEPAPAHFPGHPPAPPAELCPEARPEPPPDHRCERPASPAENRAA